MVAWVRPLTEIIKYVEKVVYEMYANALRKPQFCKNAFSQVKESDTAICFDLRPYPFKVMTFAQIIFWTIAWLLVGKILSNFNTW